MKKMGRLLSQQGLFCLVEALAAGTRNLPTNMSLLDIVIDYRSLLEKCKTSGNLMQLCKWGQLSAQGGAGPDPVSGPPQKPKV